MPIRDDTCCANGGMVPALSHQIPLGVEGQRLEMQSSFQNEQQMIPAELSPVGISATAHFRASDRQAVGQGAKRTTSRDWSPTDVAAIAVAALAFLIPAFLNGF